MDVTKRGNKGREESGNMGGSRALNRGGSSDQTRDSRDSHRIVQMVQSNMVFGGPTDRSRIASLKSA